MYIHIHTYTYRCIDVYIYIMYRFILRMLRWGRRPGSTPPSPARSVPPPHSLYVLSGIKTPEDVPEIFQIDHVLGEKQATTFDGRMLY